MKVCALSAGHLLFMAFSAFGGEVPRALVEGLSSESFKDRERSEAELLSWAEKGGKNEISSVYELSENTQDPEVSKRSLKVLKALSDQDYLSDGQGYLGIQMMEEMIALPEEKPRPCIRVTRVVADSPAEKAGLLVGDLITGLNGNEWNEAGAINQFMLEIADSKPLKTVVLTIKRKNEDLQDLKVVLGRRPVENLSGINQDLELLDERAREEHFNTWLKNLKVGK